MVSNNNNKGKEPLKEVKERSSSKEGPTVARSVAHKQTFVGSINYGCAFSHNIQGPIPPVPDLSSFPAVGEALRVTGEFCEQYRVLRREVEILPEENRRLRRMLEHFLTPTMEDSSSPPKE
jgi:hypothetical protein